MSTSIMMHVADPRNVLTRFYPENSMSLEFSDGNGGEVSIFNLQPLHAWAIFDLLATPETRVSFIGPSPSISVGELDPAILADLRERTMRPLLEPLPETPPQEDADEDEVPF